MGQGAGMMKPIYGAHSELVALATYFAPCGRSSSSSVFMLEKHLADPGQSLFPHTLTRTDTDERSYAVEQ